MISPELIQTYAFKMTVQSRSEHQKKNASHKQNNSSEQVESVIKNRTCDDYLQQQGETETNDMKIWLRLSMTKASSQWHSQYLLAHFSANVTGSHLAVNALCFNVTVTKHLHALSVFCD
jgi:hypothetical protein